MFGGNPGVHQLRPQLFKSSRVLLALRLGLEQGDGAVVAKDDCVIIEPTQKDLENQGFVAGSICF